MDRAGEQVYHKRGRLKQLRAFCLTARLGNFSRAAEHLLTEPSAVSLQVRELEGELGAALLDRSRPSISLTPAGERFLRLCGPLVEAMDRLPDTFAEQLAIPASDLGVAADAIGTVFVLPELVRRFRDTRPGVGVRVRTGSLQEALALLRAGEVGLAFGAADPEAHDLLYHPIFLYEIVLVTQEDHPLAGRGRCPSKRRRPATSSRRTGTCTAASSGRSSAAGWTARDRSWSRTSDWAALKSYVEQGLRDRRPPPSACLTAGDRVLGGSSAGQLRRAELWPVHADRRAPVAGRRGARPDRRLGTSARRTVGGRQGPALQPGRRRRLGPGRPIVGAAPTRRDPCSEAGLSTT